MNYLIGIFEENYLYDISLSGKFIASINSFDEVFLIASVGLLGLLSAIVIRNIFFKQISFSLSIDLLPLKNLYMKNKFIIISSFLLVLFFICFSNSHYVFYQKGISAEHDLFFPLAAFLKWFLLYGSLLIVSVIIYFETLSKRKFILWPFILLLLNLYLINLSLLSRSMPINAFIFFLAAYFFLKFNNIYLNRFNLFISFIVIIFLSFASIAHINYERAIAYNEINTGKKNMIYDHTAITNKSLTRTIINMSKPLFINRWVGIESVMAVQAYERKGFDLYLKLLDEKPGQNIQSYFDKNIINKYSQENFNKYNFNSSPGIIAFLYYSGSYLFLYLVMILITLLGSFLSFASYKLSGSNLLFMAIIANTIAYRLISFGFAPFQQHYYFLSILLSIIILPVLLFLANCFRYNTK
tara:strand:+ start:1762 stop:2997 length:1236 start_codon:yes stop_codon:yes gene_type:complete